jgi:hypothetical protein
MVDTSAIAEIFLKDKPSGPWRTSCTLAASSSRARRASMLASWLSVNQAPDYVRDRSVPASESPARMPQMPSAVMAGAGRTISVIPGPLSGGRALTGVPAGRCDDSCKHERYNSSLWRNGGHSTGRAHARISTRYYHYNTVMIWTVVMVLGRIRPLSINLRSWRRKLSIPRASVASILLFPFVEIPR